MSEYDYNKFLSDSGDDYPKYADNIKPKQIDNTFNTNIITIANMLRDGDKVMIWKTGYQVSFKNMGTSNHTICRKNKEKSTD
jgi:hypothetical protein